MSLLAQPVITSQPTNQFAVYGGNATFSVMATGVGPLTYQWICNGTNSLSTNIITTVAGNGSTGFSGDGGVATNAALNQPLDVALDADGNLIIADEGNNRIRMVDLAGSPILQLNGVTTNNACNYQVIITSPSGSVTSSIVSLTVFYIATQPTNTRVPFGSPVDFNVSVSSNAPFSYQWFTSSGRDAAAAPSVSVGYVMFAGITDTGAGYSSIPAVHFIGGSGSGAGGRATVSNGAVTSITMTNEGSGYTSAPPVIQIDAPSPVINTLLLDQTNAMLALPAVTSTDATNYFVVLTNNYGSVTSSTVVLFVFLPPQNFTAQIFGTGLQLQLTGTPYYPYILQSATNLTPPIIWKSIRTNSADANGNWQFTDTSLNAGQKFYRAVGQ